MQGRADLERQLGYHTRMYVGDTCRIPDDVPPLVIVIVIIIIIIIIILLLLLLVLIRI